MFTAHVPVTRPVRDNYMLEIPHPNFCLLYRFYFVTTAFKGSFVDEHRQLFSDEITVFFPVKYTFRRLNRHKM